MLQRIPQALLAALRAFRQALSPQPRQDWNYGVDYDRPAYLRRRASS
jgi:hypothetical protein